MKSIYAMRYVIYVLIISLVSAYLILLAQGYKLNWQTKKFQKTGAIYVASAPRDANIYINNKYISDSTPIRYNYVFPGRYDVKISRPEYLDWEKTFYVEVQYVSQDSDVILILKDKPEVALTEEEISNDKKYFANSDKMAEQKKDIFIKNESEIYFKDVYVTRLSQKITNVVWYTDKKHFIYQTENKIWFMDSDGTNIKLLAELPSDKKAQFISSDDGQFLIYENDGQIKKIRLTNVNSIVLEKYLNQAVKIIK